MVARSGIKLLALLLAAGVARAEGVPKHLAPLPPATLALMAARDVDPAAPILMRVFKKESELEVWKRARDGRYVHLKTFPICRWSGALGPKRRTGDRMAPEGFYPVAARQMNPNSAYYLSFDTGFPNAYDRAQGSTGSALMVHGTCSSMGCYAMTDRQVGEIFSLAREAFKGGQKAFQFQAFPFRMTAWNLARHRADPNIDFWTQLKEGSDRFEATGEEPAFEVVAGRYAFPALKDPAREAPARARLERERARIAVLVAQGAGAVRTTYEDGGQHPSFAAQIARGASFGMLSRPEALAAAGHETIVIAARRGRQACPGPACAEPAEAGPPVAWASLADPGSVPETEPSLFGKASVGEGATRLTLAPAARPRALPAFVLTASAE